MIIYVAPVKGDLLHLELEMMGHAHLEIRERLFDTCLLDYYDKVVSSSFDISDESTLTEDNDME